ncbi:MAG: hypothetical protein WCK05_07320 [Planctomycetota bacterium]|jgi:4-amino-4-deoxy-L-arabinose transferase-like glycosyltransferase
MDEIAEITGKISLVVVAVAVVTGILMKRKRVSLRRIHRVLGFIALALAVGHGLTIMLD